MFSYILKKISYALLTLLGVVVVIFLLFNLLPGDPAQMMLGQNETEEQVLKVKEKYGFDKPISKQFQYYLNDLSPISFHHKEPDSFTFYDEEKYGGIELFDIGRNTVVLKTPYLRESFQKSGKKVSDVISETLPNTALLALSAILIAIFLGITLGVLSALKKDSWIDKVIQLVSTLGMSIPSFFSAIILPGCLAMFCKNGLILI